jgi:hypothetical protein
MGIVPDSTVLIAAERAGYTPRDVIGDIIAKHGDIEAVLSVITIIELAHGIERAHSTERRLARERFLDELVSEITVERITTAIAFRGQNRWQPASARYTRCPWRSADWSNRAGTWLLGAHRQRPPLQKIPGLDVIAQ